MQARGKPFGFANPILYERANGPGFRDVTAYRPDDQGGSTPTLDSILASQLTDGAPGGVVPPVVGPGFDTETGLGTPTAAYPWSFFGS